MFAIGSSIPSYVHQQLHSLDCQKFGHAISTIFKLFKNTICIGVCSLKCTEKGLIRFTPLHFSLNLSPIQNLKEALNMSPGIHLYYASFSLKVPSNLFILLDPGHTSCLPSTHYPTSFLQYLQLPLLDWNTQVYSKAPFMPKESLLLALDLFTS